MATNEQLIEIFAAFDQGLATHTATLVALDAVKVRGDFRADNSFIGFDYDTQTWIDESA